MARTILGEVLRSALRIEKKLDEIISYTKYRGYQPKPMNYAGEPCPLCQRKVEYIPVEQEDDLLLRVCGCQPQQTQLTNTRP